MGESHAWLRPSVHIHMYTYTHTAMGESHAWLRPSVHIYMYICTYSYGREPCMAEAPTRVSNRSSIPPHARPGLHVYVYMYMCIQLGQIAPAFHHMLHHAARAERERFVGVHMRVVTFVDSRFSRRADTPHPSPLWVGPMVAPGEFRVKG